MKRTLAFFLGFVIFGFSIVVNSIDIHASSVINGTYVKGDDEHNPLVVQSYGADPGVMVYNNTVYIYMTNDSQGYSENGKNDFNKIRSLNCYSSKDMVNWTDHGTYSIAGSDGVASWANNAWAPCITYKRIGGRDKFFLYFANGSNNIGVLTADSPLGPWKDPLGHPLITYGTPGCAGIKWLFDPAVLVDSDGAGYLYFGGGVPEGQNAHPNTMRVIRLGNDMISTVDAAVPIDAPYLFEDSGINKIGNTYYYSYCSNWNCAEGFSNAAIEYMTSESPMGPFVYRGEIMRNPGEFFPGSGGSNHHCIFEFQGSYYMAYQMKSVEIKVLGKHLGYRTTQINRIDISDGNILPLTPTMSGVAQTSPVNPYNKVQAETIFSQAGVRVVGTGDGQAVVKDIQNGDFTKIKGVNFKKGLKTIKICVKTDTDVDVEVRESSREGNLLGIISASNTSGKFIEFSGQMSSTKGTKDICFVFKGPMEFDYWSAN